MPLIAQDFFDEFSFYDDAVASKVHKLGPMSEMAVPTPISNANQVLGVIPLLSTGYYKVIEHLFYPVVISANGVVLNLNCYRVSVSDPNANIITVLPLRSKVYVYNGYIHNTGGPDGSGSGVVVGYGSSQISFKDLKIFQCGYGMRLLGLLNNEITSCQLTAVDCIANAVGLQLQYADATIITGCRAIRNTQIGFELLYSNVNCFYNCCAIRTMGTGTVAGFKSEHGQNNLFKNCVAKQTANSSTTFGDKACGFLLTGTELKTKLIDCIVNETDVVGTSSAVTSGIEFQPVIQPDADLLSLVATVTTGRANIRTMAWSPVNGFIALVASDGARAALEIDQFNGINNTIVVSTSFVGLTPLGCAWSPNGKFVVVSSAVAPQIVMYSFDGQALRFITNIATTSQSYCVAWSPNGKYIAVNDATGGGSGGMRIFSFDGTTMTLLDSSNFTTAVGGGYVFSWSADGTYIVVGPRANNLIAIPVSAAGKFGTQASVASGTMTGVACSPCGKYVATADTPGNLAVWQWTGSTLTQVTTVAATAASVVWSPDGQYIAVGTIFGGLIRVYQFTGTGLTLLKTLANSMSGADDVFALTWSPDGQYIAAARMDASNSGMVIVRAMYGPANCLVDSCRVCDTAAANMNIGRGLVAGGSIACTNNACCNNGVNYSYGIPNVYYGRFEILRGAVEPFDNISEPTTL